MKILSRYFHHILLVLLLASTAGLYFGLISDGTGRLPSDEPKTVSYNMLGDAFLHRQTALLIEPDPHLLVIPNPSETSQLEKQNHYALEDASLFKGHYYLYFGPVPGILHALYQRCLGQQVPQSACIFFFGMGSVVAFLRVLTLLRREILPHTLASLPIGIVAIFALGGTGPFLQSSADIYHEAILTGGCFLLCGFGFWIRSRQARSNRRLVFALLSALCFSLAIGTRIDLVLYAVAVFPVMLIRLAASPPDEKRGEGRTLIAYLVPLVLTCLLLMAYNYQRFGVVTEFGGSYQLVGSTGALQKIDLRLFMQGATTYLAHAPRRLAFYPFQECHDFPLPNMGWYREDPFCGMMLAAPLGLLAPLAVLGLRPKRIKKGDEEGLAVPSFVLGAGAGCAALFGLLCSMAWVAMRYMHDFLPVALLLGAIALWQLEAMLQERRILLRILQVTGGIVAIVGILCGCTTTLAAWNMKEVGTEFAFSCDAVEGKLIRGLTPNRWPSLYLDEVAKNRPLGAVGEADNVGPAIFVVEGSQMTIPVQDKAPGKPGLKFDPIEALSLFGHTVRMQIEVNGKILTETLIEPGRQIAKISPALVLPASNDRQMRLRLRFPNEPARKVGELRPIILLGIGSGTTQSAPDTADSDTAP